MPPLRPSNRRAFEVATVCALPIEAECVEAVFDQKSEIPLGKVQGDPNAYTTGVIGRHHVVLAHMPRMGKVRAATVAANLSISFPNIKFAFVVGICGAVPFRVDTGEEIVLGDIIISQAICQYDLGKQHPDAWETRGAEETYALPSAEVESILAKLKTSFARRDMERDIVSHLIALQQKLPQAAYPGADSDRLYGSSYLHKHRRSASGASCSVCENSAADRCSDSRGKSCEELGCEREELVGRQRLTKQSPEVGTSEERIPKIHFGRMGSGDTVMKSGTHRDIIARKEDLIAFEMDGAGVWQQFPNSLVVKGVCDYADSHKNKRWQFHAAATTAACVKSLLNEIQESTNDDQELHGLWRMPFHRHDLQDLVGRKNEIARIESKLFRERKRGTVAILGLGGIGKTRLAMEIGYRTREQRQSCSVYWIEATSTETLERDYLAVGQLLNLSQAELDQQDIKRIIQTRLSDEATGKWLLILDSADDDALWCKGLSRSPDSDNTRALSHYLPASPTGNVLVTTRSRKVATWLASSDTVPLDELSIEEAENVLKNVLIKTEILSDRENTAELLNRLTCLPLAIVQAASYINENDESIKGYLRLMDEPEDDVIELLSIDFNDKGRYKTALNPIATTWRISFEQIRRQNREATAYLAFMSCLGEKNIPHSLLPPLSAKKMADALGTLKGYSFLKAHDEGGDHSLLYDMHRLVRLATRNSLKSEGSIISWTRIALQHVSKLAQVTDPLNHLDGWTVYLPHLQVLCGSPSGKDVFERLLLQCAMGTYLEIRGEDDAVLALYESDERWQGGQTEINGELIWGIQGLRAAALARRSRWTQAETIAKCSLEWHTAKFGPEDINTAVRGYELAMIYQYQKRWIEAEERLNEAIRTMRRVLGSENESTLDAQAELANAISGQGRYEEAEELLLRTIESSTQALGPAHLITLKCMTALADMYMKQTRYKEAEKLQLELLDVRQRTPSSDVLKLLTLLISLGTNYSYQDRVEDKERICVQSVTVHTKVLGEENKSTLNEMERLAVARARLGRFEEAVDMMTKCVKIREKLYSSDPETEQSKIILDRILSAVSDPGKSAATPTHSDGPSGTPEKSQSLQVPSGSNSEIPIPSSATTPEQPSLSPGSRSTPTSEVKVTQPEMVQSDSTQATTDEVVPTSTPERKAQDMQLRPRAKRSQLLGRWLRRSGKGKTET